MLSGLLLALIAAAPPAADDWETVVDGPPYTIKNRSQPNSEIKEVWAEGDLDAAPGELQDVLVHPEKFKHFMPNLRDAYQLGEREPDGSVFVYTELELPVVTSRDYAEQVWLDEGVKPDGSGAFRQHWKAVPNKVPEKRGLVRVQVNTGSWAITPIGDGTKSHVVYKFATDPGGAVPKFAANIGNKKAVAGTLQAIEQEAQKLRAARKADAGAK